MQHQVQQIADLEAERETLVAQVSHLDDERQQLEDRLQEHRRVHQGVLGNSQRKRQECGDLEETISQRRSSSEALERQSRETERELAEIAQREQSLREEADE